MNGYHPLAKPEEKLSKWGKRMTLIYIALVVLIFLFSFGCAEDSCTLFGIIMTVLALPLSVFAWLLEIKYDYAFIFLGIILNIFLIYRYGKKLEVRLELSQGRDSLDKGEDEKKDN